MTSCLILLTVAVVKLVVSYLYTGFSDWPTDFLGHGEVVQTVADLLLHFAADLEVSKASTHPVQTTAQRR